MKLKFHESIESWQEASRKYYLDYIARILDPHQKLQEKLIQIENKGDSDAHKKQLIFELIFPENNQPCQESFRSVHSKLFDTGEKLARQVPHFINEKQKEACFFDVPLTTESKVLKPLKRQLYHVYNLPVRVANLFRKEKKQPKTWSHKIKSRALFRFYFIEPIYTSLIDLDKELVQIQLEITLKNKSLAEPFSIDAYIDEFSSKWTAHHENIFEKQSAIYQKACVFAGTIDYQNAQLKSSRQEKRIHKIMKSGTAIFNEFNNQLFACFEDWRSDLELEGLASYATERWLQRKFEFDKWIQGNVKNSFSDISSYIESTVKQFDQFDANNTKLITQVKYELNKKLTRDILPKAINTLSRNTLLNQLDQFEYTLEQKIDELQHEYMVVKDGNYTKPLSDKDFVSISNKELIEFEMSIVFGKELNQIKNQFVTLINTTIEKLNDIDEIIQYTLVAVSNEQALVDTAEENPEQILTGGFDRAKNTLDEALSNLSSKTESIITEIDEDVEHFRNQLLELTKNESLLALRYKITKAKTIERSFRLQQLVVDKLQKQKSKLNLFSQKMIALLKKYYDSVQTYIVAEKKTDQKSRDLSNFIHTSRQKIRKLPLLYQRLYAIEPLHDDFLFEGREKEIQKISLAYQTWIEGKYSSITIYGEKWSGLTSTVNLIPKKIKLRHPLIKKKVPAKMISNDKLLEFLNGLFDKEASTIPEITSIVNEDNPRVIILEDLQHAFLKKIGGFDQLIILLKFISETQKKIFWITTISIYAHQYLDSTVNFSEYFSYPIKLDELSNNEIKSIIEKRNRISGYKIHYLPSEENEKDKKFQKLSGEHQQEWLSNKYYKELTDFSKSNISLALIFWLLSTQKIEEHTIYVEKLDSPNFSFLLNMPKIKTFLLHALILHDGLSVHQIAQILHTSPDKVEMMLLEMIEDGIIENHGDTYLVNTLVFRSIVQLLKAKNLIY